jgi:hypothetical protein
MPFHTSNALATSVAIKHAASWADFGLGIPLMFHTMEYIESTGAKALVREVSSFTYRMEIVSHNLGFALLRALRRTYPLGEWSLSRSLRSCSG